MCGYLESLKVFQQLAPSKHSPIHHRYHQTRTIRLRLRVVGGSWISFLRPPRSAGSCCISRTPTRRAGKGLQAAVSREPREHQGRIRATLRLGCRSDFLTDLFVFIMCEGSRCVSEVASHSEADLPTIRFSCPLHCPNGLWMCPYTVRPLPQYWKPMPRG